MRFRKKRIKFTAYASDKPLLVIGRIKLVMKNLNNRRVKSMAYVVREGKESLLGRQLSYPLPSIETISTHKRQYPSIFL